MMVREFVTWDDFPFPVHMEKLKNVPNHQSENFVVPFYSYTWICFRDPTEDSQKIQDPKLQIIFMPGISTDRAPLNNITYRDRHHLLIVFCHIFPTQLSILHWLNTRF